MGIVLSAFRQFMKTLDKKDIDKVHPKFRQMVREAWKNGEEVPFNVIYLSATKLNETDIEWAKKILVN